MRLVSQSIGEAAERSMAHDWHELPAWWWETNGAQGGGALNRCAAERGTARATLPCSHDMPLASSTRTVARASGGCAAALPRGCGSEAGLCCRLAPFGERAPRPLPTRGAGCGAASARKTGGGGEWPDPSCAELAQARNASSVSNCGTSSPGKSASQLRRAVSMSAAVGTQKDGSSVMGSIAVEMVVLRSGRPQEVREKKKTRFRVWWRPPVLPSLFCVHVFFFLLSLGRGSAVPPRCESHMLSHAHGPSQSLCAV